MMGRRGLLVVLCGILLGALLTGLTDRLGLKYVQGVIWPTDLYTFQHMDIDPIDVAIFGSSRASFALSPSALDACLSEELGRPTTSVNLARTFSTALTAEIVVKDLLVGDRVPKVLLLGVGPEFFNEHNHQMADSVATHADISDIPAVLWHADGLTGAVAGLWPLVRGASSLAIFLAGRHESEAQLRWMMLHHGGGQFCYGTPACVENNTRIRNNLSHRWAAATSTMLPRLADERFSRYVVGQGLVHQRMLDLIAWSEANDVTLSIVQLPLHDSFLTRIPPEVHQASEAYLRQLSQEHGIPVLNTVGPQWGQKQSYYIDPDHLGPQASELLSEHVCRGLVAPLLKTGG
jgi:hypothetical protein